MSRSGWRQIQTEMLGLHMVRNCAHYAGQCGWFYGIGILSLAQVFALEFTTPSEIYGADDFLVIAF